MKKVFLTLIVFLFLGFSAYADPTGGAAKVTSVPNSSQVLLDYSAGTNPIYIGYASQGALTSQSVWFIIKITWDANNNPTVIKSVNNAVWDDRATAYTYS